jgi:AcrR family transcriptional regulator
MPADDTARTDPAEPEIDGERWTPERRRARTRLALVDAARVVFARKGFDGASLDEIAATAGYTRGAIYKHFRGKEDLLFAVYDQANEAALQRYAGMLDADPTHPLDAAAIVGTWQELFVRGDENRALALEFELYALRNPAVGERFAEHRRHNEQLVAEFMRTNSRDLGMRFAVPIEVLSSILLITSDAFLRVAQSDRDGGELYRQFLELFLSAAIQVD